MTIFFFLRNLYVWIWPQPPPALPMPTILTETDKYVNDKTSQFLASFKTTGVAWNLNIDAAFYSKKDLNALLVDPNNEIEKTWRRRILFESTPRGNIVMYYDAFKMGFAYSSDTQCLPYAVLNAVAMKYVLTYKCRDFFMDDLVTPVDQASPLIKVHILEPPKEKKGEPEKKVNDFTKDTSAPFASLKKYKQPTIETTKDTKKNEPVKENIQNKFLSLGKMVNFKFIQKPDFVSCISGFSSGLLDTIEGETKLQKEVMNYASYKKLLEEKKQN
jgi:hypothetical protein